MTIAQLMIPELTREAEMTRRLIARVPADRLGFSPGGGLKTIGWNAGHLVEVVGWVDLIVNAPSLDLAAYPPPPGPPADVAPLLAKFDANLAQSLAALEGVPDARMDEPWTLRAGPQEILTMKKGDCLRKWVFTHTAHHRGILSASLRLAGVGHGSIYEE